MARQKPPPSPPNLGKSLRPATRPTGRGARTLEKKRPLGFSKAPTLDVGGNP